MSRTPIAALLLAVLSLLALAPAAHAATPKKGRFAGKLGVKVPKGAEANVRAISRADGTVAAMRTVKRSGAFSLTLPAGAYVIVGTDRSAAQRPAPSRDPGQDGRHAEGRSEAHEGEPQEVQAQEEDEEADRQALGRAGGIRSGARAGHARDA